MIAALCVASLVACSAYYLVQNCILSFPNLPVSVRKADAEEELKGAHCLYQLFLSLTCVYYTEQKLTFYEVNIILISRPITNLSHSAVC